MIYLRSPYLSATLRGHYVLSALIPDLRRTLYHHFPSLDLAQRGGARSSEISGTDFDLSLQLHKIPRGVAAGAQATYRPRGGCRCAAS